MSNKYNAHNHSGDCHWWSYRICDCGYLMRANSHDFGEPSEQIISDWCEHSANCQRAVEAQRQSKSLGQSGQHTSKPINKYQVVYEEEPPRETVIELGSDARTGELIVLKDREGRRAVYRVDLVTHEPGRMTKLNVHFNHYGGIGGD